MAKITKNQPSQPETPNVRGLVEATLFATGKALSPHEITVITGASSSAVKEALEGLVAKYAGEPDGALEVGIEDNNAYILQIKPPFARVTEALLPMEMGQGGLRTLAAIALRQPVLQSELVEMCGRSAYDHIKDLLERELILKEPEGRSYILKTSPQFERYFQVNQKQFKQLLKGAKRVDAAVPVENVEPGNPQVLG